MLFVLSYLASLAFLTVSLLLAGLLIERWCLRPGDLLPCRWVALVALGTGGWIALLFISAALGVLRDSTVFFVLALLLLLVIWQRHRLFDPQLAVSRSQRYDSGGAPSVLLAGAAALMISVLFIQTLWPRVSWDANVYHLTVPRLYLEQGGFWRIPFNVYSNWPLNTELLFAMAMVMRSYILAKLVHFGFGCLCSLLVYQVVREESGKWAGWAAVLLLLMNPIVLLEMRVAYVDLASALYLTLGFVVVHRWLDRRDPGVRLLLMGGIFAGLAAGTKLTGIVGALSLMALMTAQVLRRGGTVRSLLKPVASLMLPSVLLVLPWLIKTWFLTGNPVYPFLFALFGGPEWSLELQRQLAGWQRSIGMGRSPVDYLLLPARVILDGGRGYARFDGEISRSWIALLPLSLWMAKYRPIVGRALLVSATYFVFWALSSQQIRFLIPILPLLAIAGAIAIHTALERIRDSEARSSLLWVCSLILVAGLGWSGWSFGVRSVGMLRDYLHYDLAIEDLAPDPIYQFINEELPANARIMMLNTNHGFFCRRDFIADSFFEASQIGELLRHADSGVGIGNLLRDMGITHLLIENRDRGIDYPGALADFLNDSRLVESIYRSPDDRFDVARLLAVADSPAGDAEHMP
ncbi:MAG: hypothetical protein P8Y44_02020 [Acidobacteriota bacterium]